VKLGGRKKSAQLKSARGRTRNVLPEREAALSIPINLTAMNMAPTVTGTRNAWMSPRLVLNGQQRASATSLMNSMASVARGKEKSACALTTPLPPAQITGAPANVEERPRRVVCACGTDSAEVALFRHVLLS